MIRLISFDLDDTFWDVATVMNQAETTLRQWLGEYAPKLGAVPLTHLAPFRAQLLKEDPLLKFRLSELRERILNAALLEAGYTAVEAKKLARAGFEVFLEARHQVAFFDQVKETLEALSTSHTLAVITNGNADVRRLGIGHYFDCIIGAEALGVGKPHNEPFAKALELTHLSATEAVHIGDHPRDDILGAQNAGFGAIWFNPSHQPWTGLKAPDAEISHLSELPKVVHNWPGH